MIVSSGVQSCISIERTPISQTMRSTLKTYIAKQRQKQKEEQEQDAALHMERKKREIQRQQDTASLGQTNKQITQMETKLEDLKKEKHDLFARLKKVLNFEEEQRRRVQLLQTQHAKEASEVLAKVGPVPAHLLISGASPSSLGALKPLGLSPVVPPTPATSVIQSASSLTPVVAPQAPPLKRPRSPSPHNNQQCGIGARRTSQGSSSSGSAGGGFLSPKPAPVLPQSSQQVQKSPSNIKTSPYQLPPAPIPPAITNIQRPPAPPVVASAVGATVPTGAALILPSAGGVSQQKQYGGAGEATSAHHTIQLPYNSQPPPQQLIAATPGHHPSASAMLGHPQLPPQHSSYEPRHPHPAPHMAHRPHMQTPSHMNIPVVASHQRHMGSLTSGYPLHRQPYLHSGSGGIQHQHSSNLSPTMRPSIRPSNMFNAKKHYPYQSHGR